MVLWFKKLPLLKGERFKGKLIFFIVLTLIFISVFQSVYAAQFRVTHYYTPSESNFESWSTYGCTSSVDCCNINKKGFYEEVRCQGSGLGNDNCLYRYHNIAISKEASKRICEAGKEVRGITATGTNPTKKRTIAVDPAVIPLGKTVMVNFGDSDCARQWNGCYVAEDTGGAVKGSHIDLYVGVGKNDLVESSCLPRYADIEVKECNPEVPVEKETSKMRQEEIKQGLDIKYSMKPSFKTSVDYDLFGKYEGYAKQARATDISAIKECLKNGIGLEGCKSGNIQKIEEANEGTLIKFSIEEYAPLSFFKKDKIKIRFALMVNDIVPPPMVEDLSISTKAIPAMPNPNTGSTGKSAVISWKKSPARDLKGYYIFYSKNDFSEVSGEAISVDSSGLPYILPGLEVGTYYFAVVAFDESGNYISRVKTVSAKVE